MLSVSATTSLRWLTSLIVAALAIAALPVMVAPAASMSSKEADNWGAAATVAKQQTRTTASRTERQILAQYGWGAAATYAKFQA